MFTVGADLSFVDEQLTPVTSQLMVPEKQKQLNTAAFIGLFFLTALPLVSSPVALVAGFSFSFVLGNPLPQLTARLSKTLLKLSVVGLGFGVNFVEVIE
ncbi:MAG: hypothetical protein P8X54_11040, partial [Desulfuromonadales bacterium]